MVRTGSYGYVVFEDLKKFVVNFCHRCQNNVMLVYLCEEICGGF